MGKGSREEMTVYTAWVAYLCTAVVVTAASSALADRWRIDHSPNVGRQGIWIMLAGALWPFLIIGVAQLGMLLVVARIGRGAASGHQC